MPHSHPHYTNSIINDPDSRCYGCSPHRYSSLVTNRRSQVYRCEGALQGCGVLIFCETPTPGSENLGLDSDSASSTARMGIVSFSDLGCQSVSGKFCLISGLSPGKILEFFRLKWHIFLLQEAPAPLTLVAPDYQIYLPVILLRQYFSIFDH